MTCPKDQTITFTASAEPAVPARKAKLSVLSVNTAHTILSLLKNCSIPDFQAFCLRRKCSYCRRKTTESNDFCKKTIIFSLLNLKNKISHIFLEVSIKNIPAQKLYQKFNFVQTGIRKNYYQTNDGKTDALCLTREIL